jgi:hypothetical protein
MPYTANQWRFFLGTSIPGDDILDNRLHELKLARGRTFETNLLGAGSATFTYPLSDRIVQDIKEITTCLIITFDTRVVWSGPIMQTEQDYANNSVQVSATGWWEILDYRFIEPHQESFVNFMNDPATDSTIIAMTLLDAANVQQDSRDNFRHTGIDRGRMDVSQARKREYKVGDQISQAIRDLATIENGFDYEINPASRLLDIYYPRKGTLRPEIILGYNWGPNNVGNLRVQTDGAAVRNRHRASTTYIIAEAEDDQSIDLYNMRTEISSLGDVTDNIAGAYANGEVAFKSQPKKTLTITLRPGNASPQVFRHFEIGDTLYLTARGGRDPIEKQAVRVFGVSVSIDENGLETVSTLKTSPDS